MTTLSVIQFIIIIGVVWKRCVTTHGKIEVNHILCFSVGYIFYCLIPICVFLYIKDIGDSALNSLAEMYNRIPIEKQVGHIIVSFLFYLSFILGSTSASKYRVSFGRMQLFHDRHFDFNKVQEIAFIPVFLLGVFLVYKNRISFGVGYTGEKYASSSLFAYEFILNEFVLMYLCTNHNRYSIKRLILNKWVLWFAIYSVLLLTTGGRLYVITSLVSEIVFYSCIKKKGLNIRRLGIAAAIIVLGLGAIGVIRLGIHIFGMNGMILNVFSETLYTNWSTVTYIENYSIFNGSGPLLSTLSSFINLVPSFFFPNKVNYIHGILEIYPLSKAPGGASHFFINFNGGFGTIASIIFFYLFGRWLERLHTGLKHKEIGPKVFYCFVTANLVFTLFRDPFSVSIVKNIFELSILIPSIIIWLGHKLTVRVAYPQISIEKRQVEK